MADLAASSATTALALVFVLALAWLVLRAIRRLQRGAGAAQAGDAAPQILRSVGLGPRERLVSVRYRGRDYLLGVTPAAITLIDRDAADEVSREAAPRAD